MFNLIQFDILTIIEMCEIEVHFLFADDYNRVVLDQLEGQPDSDYINASYVDVSILTIKQYYFF